MPNEYGLPELSGGDAPYDLAHRLRVKLFASQEEAADYFGIVRSTVNRYERHGHDSVTPPIGYLAGLMKLLVDRAGAAGVTASELSAYQEFFLQQIRELLARYGEAYNYFQPFRDWAQLCQAADSYRTKHTGLQPFTSKSLPSTPSFGRGSIALPHLPPAPAVSSIAVYSEQQVDIAWPPGIPNEPYYALPGREEDIEQLMTKLKESESNSVLVVDGLGGLGKTALAVELCRRALDNQLFERVVGDSAKLEVFSGGEIISIREAVLDFDVLLNAIAGQVGLWELTTLRHGEKRNRVEHLLRHHRFLVLVDNLETSENASRLVWHLHDMLGKNAGSKVIATSRKKVDYSFVSPLSVRTLSRDDTFFFIRMEAAQRSVAQLQDASIEMLESIYEVSGGALLALRLIVAQGQFIDIQPVLDHLKNAGSNLYRFIFAQSWSQLLPAAQQLLIYIGRTVATTVSWEELCGLDITDTEADLYEALNQLVTWSLLETHPSPGHIRYGIHQLTRYFVVSDLLKL